MITVAMLAWILGMEPPVVRLSQSRDVPPPAPHEMRAAWIATVDNIDWPPKNVTDPTAQRKQLVAIMDRAQRLHFNAVILQVRPQGDALYASNLEPWSEYLTGTQGKAPAPYYDPLEFAVKEAHLRGLELHAWFNPYRVWHPSAKSKPASNYIGYTHPEMVRSYGQFKWLDPGAPGVRDWSQKVIMDVVRRYDIDGVHLDDYFYPYPIHEGRQNVPFPDDASWNQYRSGGGQLSRDDWRRSNIDGFVSSLYSKIKTEKPWVKFGISPFGIYRPGYPSSIKAGLDQYGELYADPVKWLEKGWCDYLAPQLYWPIEQQAQSYPVLLKWWLQQDTSGRHVWPGNMVSTLNSKIDPKEVIDQIAITRKQGAGGNVFYSMVAFMKDYKGIDEKLLQGPFQEDALLPTYPWLRNKPPHYPHVEASRMGSDVMVNMKRADSETWEWAIYFHKNGAWKFDGVTSADRSAVLVGPKGIAAGSDQMAISSVDRYGNESDRVIVQF